METAEDCREMREKIEALHCMDCVLYKDGFCRFCTYQACREAFDLMEKHQRVTEKYYNGQQIGPYRRAEKERREHVQN